MAKPINPYQGPAPAAMAQMGQGILEAGANAARITQAGYESMGKGLAAGITSATNSITGAYTEHKNDQAKFDATKKMVKAFEDYLPKQIDTKTGKEFSPMADKINGILNDTTISTREKVAMNPMIMSFLGNAQQQYGKESIANIMAGNRLDVAAAKNPSKPEPPAFNAAPAVDPFSLPLPTAPSQAVPQALQPSQTKPQPEQQQTNGKMPLTKFNMRTKEMEFWSPGAKRYIPEPVDFGINPFQ